MKLVLVVEEIVMCCGRYWLVVVCITSAGHHDILLRTILIYPDELEGGISPHHDLDGVIPEDVQLTQDYIVCNTEQGVCQAHLFRNTPKNIDY